MGSQLLGRMVGEAGGGKGLRFRLGYCHGTCTRAHSCISEAQRAFRHCSRLPPINHDESRCDMSQRDGRWLSPTQHQPAPPFAIADPNLHGRQPCHHYALGACRLLQLHEKSSCQQQRGLGTYVVIVPREQLLDAATPRYLEELL